MITQPTLLLVSLALIIKDSASAPKNKEDLCKAGYTCAHVGTNNTYVLGENHLQGKDTHNCYNEIWRYYGNPSTTILFEGNTKEQGRLNSTRPGIPTICDKKKVHCHGWDIANTNVMDYSFYALQYGILKNIIKPHVGANPLLARITPKDTTKMIADSIKRKFSEKIQEQIFANHRGQTFTDEMLKDAIVWFVANFLTSQSPTRKALEQQILQTEKEVLNLQQSHYATFTQNMVVRNRHFMGALLNPKTSDNFVIAFIGDDHLDRPVGDLPKNKPPMTLYQHLQFIGASVFRTIHPNPNSKRVDVKQEL